MLDELSRVAASLLGLKNDFQRTFFKNELRSLLGRNNKTLYILFFFIILVWISLGYALAGMRTLSKRMNNPYTNWVDWQIPNGSEELYPKVAAEVSHPDTLMQYALDTVTGYCKEMRAFQNISNGQYYYLRGRTMDSGDALLLKILSSESGNVLAGLKDPDESNEVPTCGIIVKREMLQSLGYTDPIKQKLLPLKADTLPIYMPIISVVEELPSLCDYIISPTLFNALVGDFEKTGFILKRNGSVFDFSVMIHGQEFDKNESMLFELLADFPINKIDTIQHRLNPERMVVEYVISFLKSYPADTLEKHKKRLIQRWSGTSKMEDAVNWECPTGIGDIDKPYYAAFYFNDLKKVRPFKNMLQDKFGIKISMDQVESKENFSLVSKLTFFIIIGLFVFSAASIILFINNKLSSHLEQNRPNLGTFKAFGLQDQMLIRIYVYVILNFLLLGFFLAALVAIILSLLTHYITLIDLVMLDYRIFATFLVLFLIALSVSIRTIGNILRDTPGNLIYGR